MSTPLIIPRKPDDHLARARCRRASASPILVGAIAGLLAWGLGPMARAEEAVAAATEDPSELIAGIVHYTRWPDAAVPLRVCVDPHDALASPAGARRLADALSAAWSGPVAVESRTLEPAALADCQALYVGELVPAADWQALVKALVNRPVLTVGFGSDFCSWGGQFCLERSGGTQTGGELRIHANLDAIARSGLRVNPQLLRLTQRGARPAAH